LKRTLILGTLLAVACHANGPAKRPDPHVAAAAILTNVYSASRLNAWHIRATAAGDGCSVLFLQTEIFLEDSMMDAMYYGAGSYNAVRGGTRRFMQDHAFRAVAYKDVSGRIRTYGSVSPDEAERLVPCH